MAAFVLWLLYGFGARLTEDELLEGAVSHEVSLDWVRTRRHSI
jgi:hypothetical protein